MIAAIAAGFNLLMVTTNTAIAASNFFSSTDDDAKQVDGRERTREAPAQHSFSFVARGICNEETETCVDVWGRGYFNIKSDEITGTGGFTKSVDNVGFASGIWSALDLISGSDKDVTFKARTTVGVVNIMIDEGDRKNPAEACAYGQLVGIASPDDALCTKNVRVSVK